MDDTDADISEDGIDRATRAMRLVATGLTVLISAWVLWDMTSSDPLGPSQRMARWWEQRRRVLAQQRAQAIELGNFSVELSLYLEREVRQWRSKYLQS